MWSEHFILHRALLARPIFSMVANVYERSFLFWSSPALGKIKIWFLKKGRIVFYQLVKAALTLRQFVWKSTVSISPRGDGDIHTAVDSKKIRTPTAAHLIKRRGFGAGKRKRRDRGHAVNTFGFQGVIQPQPDLVARRLPPVQPNI